MYCKLFASLYQGTLRGKSHEILVFTNLLAHCDKEGFVDKHFKAIADEVGLTLDEVKKALETLEAPDHESRSSELDGARIERIESHREWGWRIVNYVKYSEILNYEERREYNRVRQAEYRAQKRDSRKLSMTVNDKPHLSQVCTHIDIHVDKNKNVEEDMLALEVLTHLNAKAGTNFKPVNGSLKHIAARLKEGATVAQMIAVIDLKASEWLSDSKMRTYLRPQTLFNGEKFAAYSGALNAQPPIQKPTYSFDFLDKNKTTT